MGPQRSVDRSRPYAVMRFAPPRCALALRREHKEQQIRPNTANETCEIVKPKLICNPVSKDGSPIADPALHYCCYQTKCAPTVKALYDIEDQFSTLRFQTKKPRFFCTACTKVPTP